MFNKKKINIDDDSEPKNGNNEDQDTLPAEESGEEVHDITVDDEEPAAKNKKHEPTDAEKLAEMNDKYLRLHADFENFRRRTNKEKSDLILYGNRELLLKILPVYDDFERAVELMQKSENKEAAMDGINLIFNKFTTILQQVP